MKRLGVVTSKMILDIRSRDYDLKTVEALIYQDILSKSILCMFSDSWDMTNSLYQDFKCPQQLFSFIIVVSFLNIRVNSRLNTTPVTHLDEEVCHHAL